MDTFEQQENIPIIEAHASTVDQTDHMEPKTLAEALSSPDATHWINAMISELESLQRNNTWQHITSIPPGHNLIDTRWVYKIKRNPDGSIKKYKARLVARGFTQVQGLDYNETYAPVVKLTVLRTMLAIASYHDMEIHQMDVVTAFLNADIDTDVYLTVTDEKNQRYNVKLNKSLYGLKQSPRLWNKTIDTYLRSIGFTPSAYDSAFYVRHIDGNLDAMISLYVDDITIATRTLADMIKIKEQLKQRYEMEDMGELHYLLGIQITRNRQQRTISLNQTKYIDDIIKRYLATTPIRPIYTAIDPNTSLTLNPLEEKVDIKLYQSIIGSLMYVMIATRPDIAYAVSKLSQYLTEPRISHHRAAIRVLSYLYATKGEQLTYGGATTLEIIGYSDADFANDTQTRRSTSGYVFMLNNGAISWKAQRQRTTALSTAEAEYIALAEATKEAIWLQNVFYSIQRQPRTPTLIYEDNMSTIAIANNPVNHQRTKHIDIRYHFTRDSLEQGHIRLQHIPSVNMLADIHTKPLPKPRLQTLRNKLGINQPANT